MPCVEIWRPVLQFDDIGMKASSEVAMVEQLSRWRHGKIGEVIYDHGLVSKVNWSVSKSI
jgi:hypothetical protein